MLPLPDYTRRKPLAGGRWGYYFTPPSWALKLREGDDRGPCPVTCEALGTDYDAAVRRVERVLLPLFDSWRTRGLTELAPQGPRKGTLDWLFAEYRGTLAYQKLGRKVRALHEAGFAHQQSSPEGWPPAGRDHTQLHRRSRSRSALPQAPADARQGWRPAPRAGRHAAAAAHDGEPCDEVMPARVERRRAASPR